MFIRKIVYSTLALLCVTILASAQMVDTKTGVRELSFQERLSLKTNTIDWLLLTPNISLEYDLRPYNWSRWALQLDLKGSPVTTHTLESNQDFEFNQALEPHPAFSFNHSQVRLELRNYWRTRQLTNRFMPHQYPWQKLFSTRRLQVKHPNTTYFRGVYLSYDHLSYMFGSKDYKGDAYGIGFTYGIVKPLVQYQSGNSIDLELSVSGGAAYVKDDRSRIMPALADLRVGFAYRFGNTPSYKKYRYRYDVDLEFQDYYDNKSTVRDTKRRNLRNNKTVIKDMEDMFWDLYNKETGTKRVFRERNHADRVGLDPDLASEKSSDASRWQSLLDSLNTAERHAKEQEVIKKEEDMYERIKVYEETYNAKMHYGRDIKPIQDAKRKAERVASEKSREKTKEERRRAEAELKKARAAERAEKLAAQEQRMKEKAAERAARKAAEKAEREEQKAQSAAKKRADKDAARKAVENLKNEEKRMKSAEKKAKAEIDAEVKKIKEETKQLKKQQ